MEPPDTGHLKVSLNHYQKKILIYILKKFLFKKNETKIKILKIKKWKKKKTINLPIQDQLFLY